MQKRMTRHIQQSDPRPQLFSSTESTASVVPTNCQLHSHPINTEHTSVAPQDLNSLMGREDREKVITLRSAGTEQTQTGCRFKKTEPFLA